MDQTAQANTVEGTAGFGAIEAGDDHTCAIRNDGLVFCWGSNSYGQLGVNTTVTQTAMASAKAVIGLTNARVVAAGGNHSCAVDGTSSVRCWGENAEGELGDGTTTQRTVSVAVSLSGATVVSISAGFHHTCALLSDATVQCWGRGSDGQLGNGTSVGSSTPVTVLTGSSGSTPLSGVKRIGAGDSHTCALLNNGTVTCWGFNPQNGQSTPNNRATALSGLSNVRDLIVGGGHSCVTMGDGHMWCWGNNFSGELGNGGSGSSVTPVEVQTSAGVALTGVVSMAAGVRHTCAMLVDNTTRCWGGNGNEEVGDGTLGGPTSYDRPQAVGFASERPTAITGGFRHTCASAFGRVACWGDDSAGQIGNGTASTGNVATPSYSQIASTIIETFFPTYSFTEQLRSVFPGPALDVGGSHACTIVGRGTRVAGTLSGNDGIRCWGANGERQLGNSDTTSRSSPTFTSLPDGDIIAVATGAAHTCALTRAEGKVFCWGRNNTRQASNSGTNPINASTGLTAVRTKQIAISTGDNFSCSLDVDGRVFCWGANDRGQSGTNTLSANTTSTTTPMCQLGCGDPAGLGSNIAIASGGRHTCSVRADGTVWCWGDNQEGQSGLPLAGGEVFTSEGATQVRINASQFLTGVVNVTAGNNHSCALRSDGQVWCWGRTMESQILLGTSTTPWFARRVTSGSDTLLVSAIAAGGDTACVIRFNGEVACWGASGLGQAGVASATASSPKTISNYSTILGSSIRLGIGSTTSCVIGANSAGTNGTVLCWGQNSMGQLGRGSTSPTSDFLADPVDM